MCNVSFFILVLVKWHRTLNWELIWVVRFGCLPVSLGKQANYLCFLVREAVWYLGLQLHVRIFFFFPFFYPTEEAKEISTWQGILKKNTYFCQKISCICGGKNIANEQFRWRNKVAVYLTTTLKHSINSAWFQEISHNYLRVKIQPVYIS